MASKRAHKKHKKVVLVGREDEHMVEVGRAVKRAGGAPLLVDLGAVPRLAVSDDDGDVRVAGTPLHDARALYVKAVAFSPPLPEADDVAGRRGFRDWRDRYRGGRESFSFVWGLLSSLDDGSRTMVNPLRTLRLHLEKAHQVALLKRAGVDVPSTFAGSDAAALVAFVHRHWAAGRQVIMKPLAAGAAARLVVSDDLDARRLEALADCPALLQERVVGRELRVFVLDGEVVGAFDVPTAGTIDARANLEAARAVRLRAHDEIARASVRAAEGLGLTFCGVDVRVSEAGADAGRVVVLEANPTPAVRFYQRADARGSIVQQLASYLVARA